MSFSPIQNETLFAQCACPDAACIAHDSRLHQDGVRVDGTRHLLINGRSLSVFPPGDSFQSAGIYFQMVIDSEETLSMQQQFNNAPV